MLRYGGYTWLLDVHDSPIQARIGAGCRAPDAIHWQVDLHYIAAGREWRRVKSWLRPTIRFCVYGIQPVGQSWQDLEGQCFSSDEEAAGGTLFVESRSPAGSPAADFVMPPALSCVAHRLQFVSRRGLWFTTELAAYTPATPREHSRAMATVNAGNVERSDQHVNQIADDGGFYLVEDLPFGLVEVAVPVNARSPIQYARAKAAELTGLQGAVEADVGTPHSSPGGPVGGDWRVRLHHGSKWTHFTL